MKIKKKTLDNWVVILLIMFIIGINIHFRTFSYRLPITDEWAMNNVEIYYKNQISNQIDEQYPGLPAQHRNNQIQQEYDIFIKNNPNLIEQQKQELSQQFKDKLQDETGQTYLIAIDPYYYLRHVNHYLEYGQAGTIWTDQMEDTSAIELMYPAEFDKYNYDWDGQRMAPVGAFTGMTLHTYVGAYLHKLISIFNPDQTTMATMFALPVILISLAVIPVFFIAKKLAGNVAGLFAGLMLVLNPNLLSRTIAGFSDTDSYTILLPLLIVWLIYESVSAEDNKPKYIFGILSGLCVGLFAVAWVGWWYVFDFILAGLGVYGVYLLVSKRDLKGLVQSSMAFIVTSFVTIGVLTTYHFKTFFEFINGPMSFLTFKSVAVKSLWPTVRTTVAELNPASYDTILSSIGGNIFLIMAILGLILAYLNHKKDSIFIVSVVGVWMTATIYASLSGIRFVILLVPAFVIAFGAFIGYGINYLSEYISKLTKINYIPFAILFMVSLLFFVEPIQSAQVSVYNELPSMNDAWYGALTKIKTNSSEDAIINSWWDFGHWFITIADRKVTFDGGGQDEHMAYWIGRSLFTSDEKHAAGILRMVDCGNNNAFYALNNKLNDTPKSIELLNKIIVMDKEKARMNLQQYIDDKTIEEVLRYSHCEPPENYYITSEDMVMKSGVWSHFGSWDFERAELYMDAKKDNKLLITKHNLSIEQASELYTQIINTEADHWIANWYSYVSPEVNCKVEGELLYCPNNVLNNELMFITNMTDVETYMPTTEGELYPVSVVYINNLGVIEKVYDNPDIPYSIALIPQEGSIKNIMMMPELATSTFTKLFFYKGYGMDCFELFDYRQQFSGGEIYVWKVNWRCLD